MFHVAIAINWLVVKASAGHRLTPRNVSVFVIEPVPNGPVGEPSPVLGLEQQDDFFDRQAVLGKSPCTPRWGRNPSQSNLVLPKNSVHGLVGY